MGAGTALGAYVGVMDTSVTSLCDAVSAMEDLGRQTE